MTSRAIYEGGRYLRNNPTWHEEDSPWKAERIVWTLKRNGISPSTICEVGCGAGEILNIMARQCGSETMLSGYEISPDAFAICENKKQSNLRFYCQDLFAKQIRFDLVMAIDVVEHVEDCFGFLRDLKAYGEFKLLHIPLDLSAQSVIRASRLLKDRESVGHIHYFTKETALAILKDTGYEILDHFYTSPSLSLPGRSYQSKLMRTPRRLLYRIAPDLTVRALGGFSLMVLAR